MIFKVFFKIYISSVSTADHNIPFCIILKLEIGSKLQPIILLCHLVPWKLSHMVPSIHTWVHLRWTPDWSFEVDQRFPATAPWFKNSFPIWQSTEPSVQMGPGTRASMKVHLQSLVLAIFPPQKVLEHLLPANHTFLADNCCMDFGIFSRLAPTETNLRGVWGGG